MKLRPLHLVVAAAILAAAVWGWRHTTRPWRPTSPAFATPQLALTMLTGPKTFFPSPAREALNRARPELIPHPLRDPASEASRRLAQATQDPALFRALDRELRFDEIWLPGEPSTFKPLLEHLLDTPDFTLAYLDHTSLIFRRGAAAWKAPAPDAAAPGGASAPERAFFLAHASVRLALARRGEDARRWLEHATTLAEKMPDLWSAWATYHMTKGDWSRALEAADRSLKLAPGFIPGLAAKVQSLYATRRFSEAYELSKTLLAASPNEPSLLFYHAKLAHEARAFDSEIEAMTRLISHAEAAGLNVSGYRVYLAQAHAGKGDAEEARNQVSLALLDPSLPREQRKFADELLTRINERVGKIQ